MIANPHSSRKITKPVREKVTNAWLPVTEVIEVTGGLTEVIRIASGDNSYDLPSRGTIVFKKKIQLNNSV